MLHRFCYFLRRTYHRIVPAHLRLKWRAQRHQILLKLLGTGHDFIPTTAKYQPEAGDYLTATLITDVTWTIENKNAHLKGSLYFPVSQQTVKGHIFDIAGWVLEQDAPLVAIEIWLEGEVLVETKLDPTRTEANHVHPIAIDSHHGGFQIPINTLMLPETFELQVYAVLSQGDKVKICTVTGERAPVHSDYKPHLQPLTVIGLPRSGTTLLMNYLSNHPAIVAHKVYPYEFLALSYWLHFFRVLSAPADIVRSSQPNHLLDDPNFIGHHPFFYQDSATKMELWFRQAYASNLLTFCLHSIESCYQQIASVQGKADLKYFAEKLHRPTPTYHLQWSLYPQSHCIFIVRDFRDRYCSARAFTKKHGFEDNKPSADLEKDLEYTKHTRKDFTLCYNIWKRNPEQVHLVRYEDLILQPRETLANLLDQLGIALEDELLDKLLADTARDTQAYTEHRTTRSETESIGRWRTELNPQQKAFFQTHLGDLLSEFGYEA